MHCKSLNKKVEFQKGLVKLKSANTSRQAIANMVKELCEEMNLLKITMIEKLDKLQKSLESETEISQGKDKIIFKCDECDYKELKQNKTKQKG